MPTLKEIPARDIAISPEMNSWSSSTLGYLLLIKSAGEAPELGSAFGLLIDDDGHRLLIE